MAIERFKEVPPVYAVNNYTWALLQQKLGWEKVSGKVPVIPSTQQPEFMQYDKPFIVYGFAAEPGNGDLYAHNVETVAYTVYGPNVSGVNTATYMLNQAFRRFDESADDLNRWIHNGSTEKNLFMDINFTHTQVSAHAGADDQDQEGGRQDGMIVIRYGYTIQFDTGEFRLA